MFFIKNWFITNSVLAPLEIKKSPELQKKKKKKMPLWNKKLILLKNNFTVIIVISVIKAR